MTGLRERGNETSKSTGRSGRQKAVTRRNMQREERVTVQGPVKEQQPDGMSHRGEGGGHKCPSVGTCGCTYWFGILDINGSFQDAEDKYCLKVGVSGTVSLPTSAASAPCTRDGPLQFPVEGAVRSAMRDAVREGAGRCSARATSRAVCRAVQCAAQCAAPRPQCRGCVTRYDARRQA